MNMLLFSYCLFIIRGEYKKTVQKQQTQNNSYDVEW